MLKRLLAALLEGAIPGAVVAFGLSKLGTDAALPMYAAAASVGALTGLVAGRPIWAKAAKVEGSLKAVAGVFIAVVVLYGLRKWLPGVQVDLTRFGAGAGSVGRVPWVLLPSIGVALAAVLEIDDAFGAEPRGAAAQRRIAADPVAEGRVEPRLEEEDTATDAARSRRRS